MIREALLKTEHLTARALDSELTNGSSQDSVRAVLRDV